MKERSEIRATLPLWLLAAFVSTLVVLLAGGGWLYLSERDRQKAIVEASLSALAKTKERQISQWRDERRGNAEALAGSPLIARAFAAYLATPRSVEAADLLAALSRIRERLGYGDILLADAKGAIRGSLVGRPRQLDEQGALAFSTAVRGRQVAFSDLAAGSDQLPTYLDIVAPISSSGGADGPPAGAIVLRIYARDFLFPLIQSWPTSSATAETYLVRRDGENVLFLNELRFQKDTALRLRIPMSAKDVPAVMAARGTTGVVYGKNYHGVQVVSVIRAVPDSKWIVLATEDVSELFADWHFRAAAILSLLLVLIAAEISVFIALWERNQKRYYLKLFKSEERYQITMRSVADGVIATDHAGSVQFMNPAAEELTGWSHEAASGRPLTEVFRMISDRTRQEAENPVNRVIREGLLVEMANHTLLIRRDGAEHSIASSGAPIRTAEGSISGVVLVFRDVSERQRAENRRILLEAAIDQTAESVVITDSDGKIQYVNRAFEAISGYTSRDVIGSTSRILKSGEHDDAFYRGLWGTITAGRVWKGQFKNRKKDGSLYAVDAIISPIRDDTGAVTNYVAVKRDRTRERQLEAQLLQAQKMESVGRLAGGVAHDFNNMLQVITSYAQMVLQKVEPEGTLHKYLVEIGKAAQRSADITRQLLTFARKQTVSPRVLELNAAVEGTLKMLRRLIGEDIDLVWAPGSGRGRVNIDPSQLDQILANLAVNARDAIEGVGRITIETGVETFDAAYCADHLGYIPGGYALLSISDTGSGMDQDTRSHLFEPFFTTKAPGKGTGLGLSTVYGIVKQNGGFVDVHSEPGAGATFWIYLPLFTGGEGSVQAVEEAEPLKGGTETILIVEDEVAILNMSREMLEGLGYTVLTAATSKQATDLAEANRESIRLLITDVVLPQTNGRELAGRINGIVPGLKCLYMSGYTADVIAHHGVLDEGISFISKPFSLAALAKKVRAMLG